MRKPVYCATSTGRVILLIQAVHVKYSHFLTADLNFPSKYGAAIVCIAVVLQQPTIAWYDVQDAPEYFKEPDSYGLNANNFSIQPVAADACVRTATLKGELLNHNSYDTGQENT